MLFRRGPAGQEVFQTSFSSFEVQTLNAPKPFICMAVLEAVYLFRLLPVCTKGRYVNRIFRAVRKLRQRVADGTRSVRGGCSGNHWRRMFRLPANGDFRGRGESGKHRQRTSEVANAEHRKPWALGVITRMLNSVCRFNSCRLHHLCRLGEIVFPFRKTTLPGGAMPGFYFNGAEG